MVTIIEDYVSYEVAKLLKEKGFDEPCLSYYWSNATHDPDYTEITFTNKNLYEGQMLRPTHQMAMKWLREVHNIFIDVRLSFTEDSEAYPAVYYVYILDAKSGNSLLEKAANIGELNPLMDVSDHNVPINFDSPEKAIEAAIKYTLENLI